VALEYQRRVAPETDKINLTDIPPRKKRISSNLYAAFTTSYWPSRSHMSLAPWFRAIQYGQLEMTTLPPLSKKSRTSTLTSGTTISVAQAKAKLSSVLNGVQKHNVAVTILRRGLPIAKIVPIAQEQPASGYGWMRGTVQELGDIVGPTGVEWIAGDE
jgi:prevent-host-death family protein